MAEFRTLPGGGSMSQHLLSRIPSCCWERLNIGERSTKNYFEIRTFISDLL